MIQLRNFCHQVQLAHCQAGTKREQISEQVVLIAKENPLHWLIHQVETMHTQALQELVVCLTQVRLQFQYALALEGTLSN